MLNGIIEDFENAATDRGLSVNANENDSRIAQG